MPRPKFSPEAKALALDMVAQGKSYREAAEAVGTSPCLVWQWKNRDRHLESRSLYREANREAALGYNKAYREKNPEAYRQRLRGWKASNQERYRDHQLRRRYGILSADFERMLEGQNHACALCYDRLEVGVASNKSQKACCVDHCHTTKRVRGLLCCHCNRCIISYIERVAERPTWCDVDYWERAQAYLQRGSG